MGKKKRNGPSGLCKNETVEATTPQPDLLPKPSISESLTVVKVRSIVCEKEARIQEALSELKKGARFDAVANAYTDDVGRSGGSLGWMIRGSMNETFENAAFALPPSTVMNPVYTDPPVKTDFGYHIIMIEGKK
uniref:Peptidyl-prolyl cis-trans isomerase n=1 Tax=Schistocephalus solidus TaxID=70667 RepID=A0A0X3PPA3_SCHSO